MKKIFVMFSFLIACFGICTAQTFAENTTNNNFTMTDASGNTFGGTNDVAFSWDGTKKTSVATSGQVSNASISSSCPFFGMTWAAHDVAIYGPGTYTVYDGCPAGSPGCGTGNPVIFTVGAGQVGGHMLFNWNNNDNIDVVNVWQPGVFEPSSMWTGGCGSNAASTVWELMSTDWNGDGINGAAMTDGPFLGTNANFNLNGGAVDLCTGKICNDNNACTTDTCNGSTGSCVFTPVNCDDANACTTDTCNEATGCVHTSDNSCNGASNLTMIDAAGATFGGTNDVAFSWDGTKKASVAASGQVSNASISSSCPFFGMTWAAHDVAIYGPGTYTVYDGCPAGSPGCGTGTPVTFAVGAGQLGGHMLFDWGGNSNMDVVNVWQTGSFGPSSMWTGGCGSNAASTVWELMSTDWNGDGINGAAMTDGPFVGTNANFNLRGSLQPPPGCKRNSDCNDDNACTTDICSAKTGLCKHKTTICRDRNACTTDSCDPAIGCVFTPKSCDDNNACTIDSCKQSTGACLHKAIRKCRQ